MLFRTIFPFRPPRQRSVLARWRRFFPEHEHLVDDFDDQCFVLVAGDEAGRRRSLAAQGILPTGSAAIDTRGQPVVP
jgi:hypothetical protein